MTTNKRYSPEYKQQILESLMPPQSKSVSAICTKENISRNTLYAWIAKARKQGLLIPTSAPSHQQKWRKEDKLKMVLETYSMNEAELGAYCREKGLYPSEIKDWNKTMEQSLDGKIHSQQKTNDDQKIKQLEKELQRKEKTVAELAALLVLRKKAEAIWMETEED